MPKQKCTSTPELKTKFSNFSLVLKKRNKEPVLGVSASASVSVEMKVLCFTIPY